MRLQACLGSSLAVLALLAAVPLPASAASLCHEILELGAFRKMARSESSYSSLAYAAELESMSYEQAKRDFDANGGAIISGVPFSGAMSQHDYNSARQELRDRLDFKSIMAHQSQLAVADGDPTIVAAWSNCVARLQGLVASIKPIDDDTIQLSVEYHPAAGAAAPVVQAGTHLINGSVIAGPEYLTEGSSAIGIANERLITIRRSSPDKAVYVAINTDRGSGSAYLPPRPKPVPPPSNVVIDAGEYDDGTGVARTTARDNPNWEWGDGLANGGPPYEQDRPNRAAYFIDLERSGPYSVSILYASGDSRPVDISVNGNLIQSGALSAPTGGFCMETTQAARCSGGATTTSSTIGSTWLHKGRNTLVIYRPHVFPHIKRIELTYTSF